MKNFLRYLPRYSFAFAIFGIWCPILWFMDAAKKHYSMESFDITMLNWPVALLFIFLVATVLLAQLGLFLIAKEHGDLERFYQDHHQEN